jgi:putative tryptophan/tyrosine transport system substrate-binding protein
MRRREFVAFLGGATVAWPLVARAQQATKVQRIGFLGFGSAVGIAGRLQALQSGLRDLGYIDGQNVNIVFRWAERAEQLPELAAELVGMKVDVIFAQSSTEVEPARQATQTIPIVFAVHADPVGLGHVASLARPGGNITGLTMLLTDLAAKELEVLKEAVPLATRIGVLWNPTTPSHPAALKAITASGEQLGVKLFMVPARTAEDFDTAFSTMTRERSDAFLAVAAPPFFLERTLLVQLALKHRLPGMFGVREYVEAGGLISYGANLNDLTRRAATYIVKILKGTNPAELPVEQASKYQLVINLRTAKAIGLTVPPTLLARADEVIE